MDRVKAMTLIKEIVSKIPDLGPQSMSIEESEHNNPLQTGCIIHFKGLPADCIEQIKIIVENHSLTILYKELDLAIYTPRI